MDVVGEVLDLAIKLGTYLASLPEVDRQAAIDAWRAQRAATQLDVQSLKDEVTATKADHAALLAAHQALVQEHTTLQATHATLVARVEEAAAAIVAPPLLVPA